MLKNIFILFFAILFFGCSQPKQKADLIFHHARIYSVDSLFTVYDAMAIKDGLILDAGSNDEILKRYEAPEVNDMHDAIIYPGFIDSHCHFLAYGLGLGKIDLVGTRSFAEIITRVVASAGKKKFDEKGAGTSLEQNSDTSWIIGRGWDQNDWENKEMPTNRQLDSLFPSRPVILTRIDGHAALANSKALRLAGINEKTKITGGEFVREGNKLTGLLVDNAVDLLKNKVPNTGIDEKKQALLDAQYNCFSFGITTVDDAGLMANEVDIIDAMQKYGHLQMRVYAMLSDSLPNYEHFLKKGPFKTPLLNVRAFKFYADGALGSRGACLFDEYADKKGWKGFLLSDIKHFEKYAKIMDEKGFQMCTHCIGDSAVHVLTEIYEKYCNGKQPHRWRIEHAQVLAPGDIKQFSNDIIPSVQPTHATSDMYWAETRLGKSRVRYAYAYGELLKASGIVALGTDFPVEGLSPFKTFYSAVVRQDEKGYPEKGFQPENALTREQAIRGMTIWGAYANFEEMEKGSLEKGKYADFIILSDDLMKCAVTDILKTYVRSTWINGKKVWSRRDH